MTISAMTRVLSQENSQLPSNDKWEARSWAAEVWNLFIFMPSAIYLLIKLSSFICDGESKTMYFIYDSLDV